jgi:glycosyltransferase involved in cell wall biosynthesis
VNTLSIYLLCHNRPDDARKAILSILNQSDSNFHLIISDNSSDGKVARMVSHEFPLVNYIRRPTIMPALEHFNCCIAEANTNYFCLFHDDDLLAPDFVVEMKKLIKNNPNAIAFGCNSFMEEFGRLTPNLFFKSARRVDVIKNARALATRYFARSQSGIAPFPGYIYNQKLIGNLRFPVAGGKYADVTWLLSLANQGHIVWLNQALMTYRLHTGNDSNAESRRDRLSFLAYLKKNRIIFGDEILQDYRCSFIYKTIRREGCQLTPKRNALACRFLNHYQWSRYARLSTYLALARRGFVKLKGL